MELVCYLHPGWEPSLHPAEATRDWMDATNEHFAYRCLPLNIANSHGWEVQSPCDFMVYWRGGTGAEDVIVRPGAGATKDNVPVSLFGHGVLTFHIFGIIRTPPGWNMFVTGKPNTAVEGIAPLAGVIETDWSPYSFTMNWRFTRRNHWVKFKKGDPIAFMFPVQRNILEQFQPRYAEMTGDLLDQFKAWSASRDAFRLEMVRNPPASPTEQWQKRYYRGLDMHDREAVPDHKARLRLAEFAPLGTKPAEHPAALQMNGDAETIGRVLRIMAQGLAEGREPDTLAAGLRELGLAEADARAVIAVALEG